uniref:Photosystem II PsbX n=1 Tax=Tetraselmis sp. GSL018 TaxID=582737 RepID=A0A061SNQ7_9CHLO|mmetsp:Transcript_11047/g.26196  ORF Transcript_11047/g.26196 Transcript_11047/m.26196 type:complete len:110 (+) Transcript_11047:164-493(+)|eukprot:CAMPEP_0177579864 /NCGR_PEP_ID=MMETSP0419_2-20121207/1208_1 /TAXON_ID=582737 /ORGANISM="Tetraselmis sp., Strain GSL018" /LENGTH=109 /DNA_ID=CAMNT_0019068601 /DNA_START=146 /DNA_END=475 /DNA_ORIENTATION=-
MALTVSARASSAPQLKQAVVGRPVSVKPRVAVRNTNRMVVRASADKREQALAAVTVAAGSVLAQAGPAEAAVPPSLKNLLLSVVAGGVVVGLIAGAVSFVANFDQVSRN